MIGPKSWNRSAISSGQVVLSHSTHFVPCMPTDLFWSSVRKCEGVAVWCFCATFRKLFCFQCWPCWVTVTWPRLRTSSACWHILDWNEIAILLEWLQPGVPWWFQWYAMWFTCYCGRKRKDACCCWLCAIKGLQHGAGLIPLLFWIETRFQSC